MRKLLALVLAAMLVMSAACAFAAETFKIGGTAPLTGGAAIYGNAAKNGAQIAVDEINAANGYVKFDLRYEDDTHDAEKAVNAYNALKDWGVQVSLSSVTSKPAEATAAENFADRIFGLTPSASAAAVRWKRASRTSWTAKKATQLWARWLPAVFGAKSGQLIPASSTRTATVRMVSCSLPTAAASTAPVSAMAFWLCWSSIYGIMTATSWASLPAAARRPALPDTTWA